MISLILAFQKVKQYLLEVVTLFMLQIQFWNNIDESIRRASIYIGFLIGLFTLLKVILDVLSRYRDLRRKSLEENILNTQQPND